MKKLFAAIAAVAAVVAVFMVIGANTAVAGKPGPQPNAGPAVAEITENGITPPAASVRESRVAAPMTAEAFTPGPYESWRWITPVICVDNHTSWTMQAHVNAWAAANDISLQYEGDCANWSNSHRIDIEFGNNSTKGCFYRYITTDANNKVARMILYLNLSAQGDCWGSGATTVGVNHAKSSGVGAALGLQAMGCSGCAPEYPPYYVSVMRWQSWNTVSYAQSGDLQTFDWYNNL